MAPPSSFNDAYLTPSSLTPPSLTPQSLLSPLAVAPLGVPSLWSATPQAPLYPSSSLFESFPDSVSADSPPALPTVSTLWQHSTRLTSFSALHQPEAWQAQLSLTLASLLQELPFANMLEAWIPLPAGLGGGYWHLALEATPSAEAPVTWHCHRWEAFASTFSILDSTPASDSRSTLERTWHPPSLPATAGGGVHRTSLSIHPTHDEQNYQHEVCRLLLHRLHTPTQDSPPSPFVLVDHRHIEQQHPLIESLFQGIVASLQLQWQYQHQQVLSTWASGLVAGNAPIALLEQWCEGLLSLLPPNSVTPNAEPALEGALYLLHDGQPRLTPLPALAPPEWMLHDPDAQPCLHWLQQRQLQAPCRPLLWLSHPSRVLPFASCPSALNEAMGLLVLPLRYDDPAQGLLGFIVLLQPQETQPSVFPQALAQLSNPVVQQTLAQGSQTLAFALQRQQQLEQIITQAQHDGLTGLLNRRTLLPLFEQELDRMLRNNRHLCLAMVDLDFFKQTNDTYGHAVGDQLLVQVAKCLQQSVRRSDTVWRYGGEEFLLLLPDTQLEEGIELLNRLRISVSQLRLAGLPQLQPSLSGGIASPYEVMRIHDVQSGQVHYAQTLEQLLQLTDKRLYQAKQSGRNCIIGSSG
ncbi:MAG: GGDEF domain-containing protein [Vampirovibrionales bacterium]